MLKELNALENKVVQVTMLCRTLRAENALLKEQLANAEAVRGGLVERMESARGRLEQLAQKLPDAKAAI
jgi:cell division protein ZapB